MKSAASNTVFLVDDHPVMRVGLRTIIDLEPDLSVIGELGRGNGAAELICKANPSIVILDWALPDATGLDVLRDLRAHGFRSFVLMLSLNEETYYAERAVRGGANGYIMKKEASEHLVEAIRRVLSGEIYLSSKMYSKLARNLAGPNGGANGTGREGLGLLTDREFEVYESMGRGLSTTEVGARLSIDPKTVATHRARIKKKLGINDMSELTHHAIRWVEGSGASASG